MGNTACGAKRRQTLANRRLGAAADSNIAASSQYSDTSGQYSSGYGGGGGGNGYVYAMMCPEGIDQDIALAATAAALAVGIYVVYRQVNRHALPNSPECHILASYQMWLVDI